MRDFHNNVAIKPSISPQEVDGDVTGAAVDVGGFSSAGVFIVTGAGPAAVTAVVEASDESSTGFTAVGPGEVVGGFPDPLEVNSVASISYVGPRRYVRVRLDHTSGAVPAAATILLGRPSRSPVSVGDE